MQTSYAQTEKSLIMQIEK